MNEKGASPLNSKMISACSPSSTVSIKWSPALIRALGRACTFRTMSLISVLHWLRWWAMEVMANVPGRSASLENLALLVLSLNSLPSHFQLCSSRTSE